MKSVIPQKNLTVNKRELKLLLKNRCCLQTIEDSDNKTTLVHELLNKMNESREEILTF